MKLSCAAVALALLGCAAPASAARSRASVVADTRLKWRAAPRDDELAELKTASPEARASFAQLAKLTDEDDDHREALQAARSELRDDGAAGDLGDAAVRESLLAASGHLLASCPRASKTGCAALGGKPSVAVFVVGTLQRLLINSTLDHLVRPIASQGFAVHLYLSLVDRSKFTSYKDWRRLGRQDPGLSGASPEAVRALLTQKALAAGACPMCVSVSRGREELPEIPRSSSLDARMAEYPPWKSEVGRNVLRVWQARERLWSAALQAEKDLAMRYSLATWTRDDQVWFSNVTSLADLLSGAVSARAVWSRSCKTWKGINDKSVILGREAAQVMLTAYSSFFEPSLSLGSVNAETFLQQLARLRGLALRRLPFEAIPSADAMLVGGQICVLKFYKCDEAPKNVYKDCEGTAHLQTGPDSRARLT